jgi:hypothetical protein
MASDFLNAPILPGGMPVKKQHHRLLMTVLVVVVIAAIAIWYELLFGINSNESGYNAASNNKSEIAAQAAIVKQLNDAVVPPNKKEEDLTIKLLESSVTKPNKSTSDIDLELLEKSIVK